MDARLPSLLVDLIEAGVWSTSGDDVDERISSDVARAWDPLAKGIHLVNDLPTVQQDANSSPAFYRSQGALAEIDPESCVVIADFGLGSDSPIVLDLSKKPPEVLRLRFPEPGESGVSTSWEKIAPDFESFADRIGIGLPEG